MAAGVRRLSVLKGDNILLREDPLLKGHFMKASSVPIAMFRNKL